MPIKPLQISTADGTADAFAAVPDHHTQSPAVLMYPDGFGLRLVLRDMASQLAGHGYYVLVPNTFYRAGPAPVIGLPAHISDDVRPRIMAELMPLLQAHTRDRVQRDAEAYLDFIAGRPEVAHGPIAVTGYCIGGLHAVLTAAAFPDQVAALAAFHAPVGAAGPSLLSTLTASSHFGHAEGDLAPDALDELNAVLDEVGIDYTSEIYPGTVHGFTMADTAAFSPSGLQRHWERLLPLLAQAFPTQ